jgi:hypothetical protein
MGDLAGFISKVGAGFNVPFQWFFSVIKVISNRLWF